jgi:hypothetical protein
LTPPSAYVFSAQSFIERYLRFSTWIASLCIRVLITSNGYQSPQNPNPAQAPPTRPPRNARAVVGAVGESVGLTKRNPASLKQKYVAKHGMFLAMVGLKPWNAPRHPYWPIILRPASITPSYSPLPTWACSLILNKSTGVSRMVMGTEAMAPAAKNRASGAPFSFAPVKRLACP